MRFTVKLAGVLCLAVVLGLSVWLFVRRQNSSPVPRADESAANAARVQGAGAHNIKNQAGERRSTAESATVAGASAQAPGANGPAGKPEEILSYAERVQNLRATTVLSPQEIETLYRYLRTPAAGAADPDGENWLRNVMLDKLTTQAELPADLSELLIGLYRDRAQDMVLRDYAVQHMALIYDRVDGPAQTALQSAMWQAVDENDSSIGGTALLGLLELSEAKNSVDSTRLAGAAFKYAADENCGELTRITAVQVCGRLKIESALPVIQRLAQGASNQVLQNAAIAALADFGTPGAVEILERLSASSAPRTAAAAQAALKRLERAAALSQRVG